MKHKTSNEKPNAELQHMNMYQAPVFKSWCLSNSFFKILWAPYARIVVRPCRVALRCVNTGLRAEARYKSYVIFVCINFYLLCSFYQLSRSVI